MPQRPARLVLVVAALHLGAFAAIAGACGDGTTATGSDAGHGFTSRDAASGTGDDDGAGPGDDSGQPAPQDSSAGGDVRDAFVWPDCNAKPATATAAAISDVWTSNYTTPTE